VALCRFKNKIELIPRVYLISRIW